LDIKKLTDLLNSIQAGTTGIDDALEVLKRLPYEDLGFARIDTHRELRVGFPESIFCEGKSIPRIVEIAERLSSGHNSVLATRASREVYEAVKEKISSAVYYEEARLIGIRKGVVAESSGTVMVITAGTSDIPVAEEAAVTAEYSGCEVQRLYDCGVAGIHRLFSSIESIQKSDAVIAVAGMEGALPSIVGGIAGKPVIAVPTSIGYGASFGGVSALLTMLNTCAPGVTVVNIDNGFGAGYTAALICRGRK
jgi:hypothetical protein